MNSAGNPGISNFSQIITPPTKSIVKYTFHTNIIMWLFGSKTEGKSHSTLPGRILPYEFLREPTFRVPVCTIYQVRPHSQSYEIQLCSGIENKGVTRWVSAGSGARSGEVAGRWRTTGFGQLAQQNKEVSDIRERKKGTPRQLQNRKCT